MSGVSYCAIEPLRDDKLVQCSRRASVTESRTYNNGEENSFAITILEVLEPHWFGRLLWWLNSFALLLTASNSLSLLCSLLSSKRALSLDCRLSIQDTNTLLPSPSLLSFDTLHISTTISQIHDQHPQTPRWQQVLSHQRPTTQKCPIW